MGEGRQQRRQADQVFLTWSCLHGYLAGGVEVGQDLLLVEIFQESF